MASIVNPNLPANLPTNWTNTQYISANGTEVGLSAQHGYNYLMQQVNAAQGAVNTLATQAQSDISGLQNEVDQATQDIEQLQSSSANATASISGNTFAITGPADAQSVTFTTPAAWSSAYSYTYNGSPITLTDLNGDPVTNGWAANVPVTFRLVGNKAYFSGATGPTGPQGNVGPQGETGPAGPGVAVGGTAGQFLKKVSGANYDTQWVTPTAADVGAVPTTRTINGIPLSSDVNLGIPRTCRFVVGTSTNGWTANDCDYLCDGTADDVEINAALQALPSTGGEVILLDGVYKPSDRILIYQNNTILSGASYETTILQKNWETDAEDFVITATGFNKNFCIRNLTIDGNKSVFTESGGCGIIISYKSNAVIDSCQIINNSNVGVLCNSYSGNIKIINSIFGNQARDISTSTSTSSSNGSLIIQNNIFNGSSYAINALSGMENALISNNVMTNNSRYTFQIISGKNVVFSNNRITGYGSMGIYINATLCTIFGNNVYLGTGQSSDYTSSQNTIFAGNTSSNNLIFGNNIMGKNYIDNGTNNTWANNKFE